MLSRRDEEGADGASMCLTMSFGKVHYPALCPYLAASLNVISTAVHHTGAGKGGQVCECSVFMDEQVPEKSKLLLRRRGTQTVPGAPPGYEGHKGRPVFKPNRYLFCDLFRKKSFKTDLVDRSESRLEPINMALGVLNHMFQQVPCGEIADGGAVGDRLSK